MSYLLSSGILLMFLGGVMLAVYLMVEKGSILDPISISWVGFMTFVPGSMIALSLLTPQVAYPEVRNWATTMALLAGVCYTIGLYTGRGRWLARLLPRPAPHLPPAHVYFIWFASAVVLVPSLLLFKNVSAGFLAPMQGLVGGLMGAILLISALVLLTYRQSWGTKLFMLGTLVAVLAFTVSVAFSRRPLTGVFISLMGYWYRTKISWRNLFARTIVVTLLFGGAATLILYIGASRGKRFYGELSVGRDVTFSKESAQDLLGGITCNWEVYEFTCRTYPEHRPFLHGAGIVPCFLFWIPRSVWPSKPMASGGVITRLWFGTDNPSTNMSPLSLGEAYMNFGVFGVTLGMFFVGCVVRGLNQYMREESDNSVLWLAWLIVTPDVIGEWRGDFTSMTVQATIRICVFLGIAWLAGKVMGSDTASSEYGDGVDSAGYPYGESPYATPRGEG